MSDGGFPQAAARFSAEVDAALTRARRAAREARAESADFRKRTEELAAQARTGKLRGVRRDQVAPTKPAGHADAAKFRVDNDLTVAELPDADELIGRLPNREPAAPPVAEVVDNDDFSQHQVLFDIDGQADGQVDEQPEPEAGGDDSGDLPEAAGTRSREERGTRSSDEDEDFSQQRILLDATVESYRPEVLTDAVFEPSDQENRR